MLTVLYEEEAEQELITAAAWYEERREGLGEAFIAEATRQVTGQPRTLIDFPKSLLSPTLTTDAAGDIKEIPVYHHLSGAARRASCHCRLARQTGAGLLGKTLEPLASRCGVRTGAVQSYIPRLFELRRPPVSPRRFGMRLRTRGRVKASMDAGSPRDLGPALAFTRHIKLTCLVSSTKGMETSASMSELAVDVSALSKTERLRLLEQIWESLDADSDFPVTEPQRVELKARSRARQAGEIRTTPASDVLEAIRTRRGFR